MAPFAARALVLNRALFIPSSTTERSLMPYQFITDEQAEQFLSRGFMTLHDCFSREVAHELIEQAFVRLDYKPDDPSTWVEKRIHMPSLQMMEVKTFAPKV